MDRIKAMDLRTKVQNIVRKNFENRQASTKQPNDLKSQSKCCSNCISNIIDATVT